MDLRNPVAELESAQHKVALSSWDPKMKELNPGQGKSDSNVEHKTQQIYNGIPVGNVSRQRRPADFRRTNFNTAEPSMTEILCTLLQQQAAPELDVEVFDSNPLNFKYFISVFEEVVETKLDDLCGRLTSLIKYTSGEAKELVRNCIHLPPEECYEKAMTQLQERYGESYQVLAAYRREIKNWPVKPDDAVAFRRFSNFLIKCCSIFSKSNWNQLDNPDVLCMLMAQLLGYLQNRWNRQVFMIR